MGKMYVTVTPSLYSRFGDLHLQKSCKPGIKRRKVSSEHRFGEVFKDIDADGTTKTVILKSVRKTAVSVGLRQGRKSDLPGRFS